MGLAGFRRDLDQPCAEHRHAGAPDQLQFSSRWAPRDAGQTCVCANRILVQDGVCDAFTKRLAETTGAMKVADGFALGLRADGQSGGGRGLIARELLQGQQKVSWRFKFWLWLSGKFTLYLFRFVTVVGHIGMRLVFPGETVWIVERELLPAGRRSPSGR
jgi:hypothetical protein